MTFKPDISDEAIANEALAMLPADPIQSLDEASLEARECKRFYRTVVGALLERHHWNLATKRVALAAVVNDRADEWPYAYAKPSDMAYPVSIMPTAGAGVSGWVMQDFQYLMPGGQRMMMQARNVFYSFTPIAQLEYTSFDIEVGDFTVHFKDIVVLNLAARIAHPITKDQQRAQELMEAGEYQTQRAIAADLNRNRPTYGNRPTESELVRGVGVGGNYLGHGYPNDPIAHPSNTGN